MACPPFSRSQAPLQRPGPRQHRHPPCGRRPSTVAAARASPRASAPAGRSPSRNCRSWRPSTTRSTCAAALPRLFRSRARHLAWDSEPRPSRSPEHPRRGRPASWRRGPSRSVPAAPSLAQRPAARRRGRAWRQPPSARPSRRERRCHAGRGRGGRKRGARGARTASGRSGPRRRGQPSDACPRASWRSWRSRSAVAASCAWKGKEGVSGRRRAGWTRSRAAGFVRHGSSRVRATVSFLAATIAAAGAGGERRHGARPAGTGRAEPVGGGAARRTWGLLSASAPPATPGAAVSTRSPEKSTPWRASWGGARRADGVRGGQAARAERRKRSGPAGLTVACDGETRRQGAAPGAGGRIRTPDVRGS